MTDPVLRIVITVNAYDEGGYGDNRSRDFEAGQEQDAIDYAKSLDKRFGATVWKRITMDPIHKKLWPKTD